MWDVVVVGGGFAGLVAARAAAERGARTLVIEKSAAPGGSASISAGMIWAPEKFELLHAYVPDGDRALQRLLCERFEEALAWLEAQPLPLLGYDGVAGVGRGKAMAIGRSGERAEFMALMAERVKQAGGIIRYHAPLRTAKAADGGYSLTFGEGAGESTDTRALLFATGGFQGNRDVLSKYLGPGPAAALLVRSALECTGDGLIAATALGAATGGAMDAFYGHTMPDVAIDPSEMQPLTPYFARYCVFVGREGRRFVDEAEGMLEELNPQVGCRQPGGKYYLIFDAAIYRHYGINQQVFAAVPTLDRLARLRELGAPILEAQSIEELAKLMAAKEGVPADTVRAELEAYSAAVADGRGNALSPKRSRNGVPLREAPFYAMRSVAGITCTCGGIRIDDQCAVLDGRGRPLPGVFAAGVDAGGVFGRTYGGFLGWALVSGYVAGRSAASSVRE